MNKKPATSLFDSNSNKSSLFGNSSPSNLFANSGPSTLFNTNKNLDNKDTDKKNVQ